MWRRDRGRGPPLRTALTTALLGALCLPLAACGGQEHDIDVVVRDARPEPRKAEVPVTAGRTTPPARWPRACELIADEEIRSVLPQATGITRGPRTGPRKAPTAEAECSFRFELPHNMSFDSSFAGAGSFELTLLAVGDPRLAARDHARRKKAAAKRRAAPDAPVPGVDSCYTEGLDETAAYVCRKGPLVFEVDPVEFRRFDFVGAPEFSLAHRATVRGRVVPAFVRIVAARV
ncbi:hypothetical protein ACIBF1_01975 [Spirillospora sp. NPDC050679]